ncbi:NAD-dependent epimerase/dehydratase family protein [Sulfitobacter noctilucicola]|uniref:UDP-glucose 4-epimerase n=1 Tax=Sulfitobacter noctilucicola TaxID=1342301 RepID=A0A7W6M5D7_9RHOB|nr:NAD-dependent epimerase/dehydratase family protein [Sulfitobacter noctilucicola]MBB4172744.1 UDP-glucose 4-epimerase [Sulfitobacter noctilucicola]
MTPSADSKLTILVTGAGGFVGRHLCTSLAEGGHTVRRIVRSGAIADSDWLVEDLATKDIPDAAFEGVNMLVHLAASMPGDKDDPNGTKSAAMAQRVATSAKKQGVPRVVLLSSVAVRLLLEKKTRPRPYSVQKRDAEDAFLKSLGPLNKCVILRPPLIYGPGARGSFGLLLSLVRRGAPMPVGKADAPRCYLSVSNLCELIETLAQAPDAQWQAADRKTFEPHDGTPISTLDLVRQIANVTGRKARILNVTNNLLHPFGRLIGKADQIDAMFEPLVCDDIEKLHQAFGWMPHEHVPNSLSFLDDAE